MHWTKILVWKRKTVEKYAKRAHTCQKLLSFISYLLIYARIEENVSRHFPKKVFLQTHLLEFLNRCIYVDITISRDYQKLKVSEQAKVFPKKVMKRSSSSPLLVARSLLQVPLKYSKLPLAWQKFSYPALLGISPFK